MRPEVKSILRLEVPIIVQIGRRSMSVHSVVSLTPGSIIELPKGAEEELELLVNNKPIGTGIAVKVSENFGIKISFIGDLKSRIEALGAGELSHTATDARSTPTPSEAAARAKPAVEPGVVAGKA